MAYQPQVRGKVDAGNTTTVTLGAAGVFTGTWADVTVYEGISVTVDGTAAATAPGTLQMQWSHDGVTVNRSIDISVADVAAAEPRTLGVIAKWFRIVYTNGAQAHTTTDIETMLHTGQVTLISRLNQIIPENIDVSNVRAINAAQDPDGEYFNSVQSGVSSQNSTTTPLGAAGVFTGAWRNTRGFHGVSVVVDGTSASAAPGTLELQWSNDGTNIIAQSTVALPDLISSTQLLGVIAKFFRLVYTNGAVAHTTFTIHTMFHTQEIVPVQPAAEQIFQTTDNLGAAGVYDSGVIDLRGYTQVDTRIVADQDGTLTIRWYSDEAGTDEVRTLTIPYSAANGFQLFSAPAFTPFNRYIYTNGATPQGDFFLEQKNLRTALSPQILGVTSFIAGGMVTQLNRSIIVGADASGGYNNVSVAPTTNSAGTFQNLQVVSGARPSQLPGRTAVRITVNNETAPTLAYTVTAGKTLYITDVLITVENAANTLGQLEVYDALTATGTPILPVFIPDPGAGSTTVSTVQHTFSEPLEFGTGVFWDEAAGTLTMSGLMLGYEE